MTWLDHRRDHTVAPSRLPGVARILVLGDSMTFGLGVPFYDALPAQIEDWLSEMLPGSEVEVVNGARPSNSLHEMVTQWRCDLARFRPDLVLLMVNTGDDLPLANEGGGWLAHKWRDFNHLMLNAERRSVHDHEILLALFGERLDELKAGLNAAGAQLLVANWTYCTPLPDDPYRELEVHTAYERICRERGIPHVSLVPLFAGLDDDPGLHASPSDWHPSPRAARIAARALVHKLIGQLPAAALRGTPADPASVVERCRIRIAQGVPPEHALYRARRLLALLPAGLPATEAGLDQAHGALDQLHQAYADVLRAGGAIMQTAARLPFETLDGTLANLFTKLMALDAWIAALASADPLVRQRLAERGGRPDIEPAGLDAARQAVLDQVAAIGQVRPSLTLWADLFERATGPDAAALRGASPALEAMHDAVRRLAACADFLARLTDRADALPPTEPGAMAEARTALWNTLREVAAEQAGLIDRLPFQIGIPPAVAPARPVTRMELRLKPDAVRAPTVRVVVTAEVPARRRWIDTQFLVSDDPDWVYGFELPLMVAGRVRIEFGNGLALPAGEVLTSLTFHNPGRAPLPFPIERLTVAPGSYATPLFVLEL